MQINAISSYRQINFSGHKHNKKENIQTQPIKNFNKNNPLRHLATPALAFMVLVPNMTSCSRYDLEPLEVQAHTELTPEIWEKNANLAINYLNNPSSLKARLTPEALEQFYQITKTDDNVPVKYFLGQQGTDGKISAYIKWGDGKNPVRISPLENITPYHIISYIEEVGDTLKTTDEKVEYNYRVVDGKPTIVIGNKVVLEILKTDDIKNKSIVDKFMVFNLEHSENI